jgi:hypothetical protein
VLGFWLMHQSRVISALNLDRGKLVRWLCRVEDGYRPNPYHCARHAAGRVWEEPARAVSQVQGASPCIISTQERMHCHCDSVQYQMLRCRAFQG